jgi:hypothetical protein
VLSYRQSGKKPMFQLMKTSNVVGLSFIALVGIPILGTIVYEQVRLRTDSNYAADRHREMDERAVSVKVEKWNSERARWDAALMSQHFVKDRLKAPASAEFQNFSDAAVIHEGAGVYSVSSFVDSQNSFGAKLRTRYRCTLQDKGNEKWHLVDLKIDRP